MVNPAPDSTLYIKAIIYRIMHYLDNPNYYLTESIHFGTKAEAKLFSEITHLMEETNGRISRSELARSLNYSGNYINHIVQKYTGLSTFEYAISFTMQKVAWMLTHSTDNLILSCRFAKNICHEAKSIRRRNPFTFNCLSNLYYSAYN